MVRRTRTFFTNTQKSDIWDRWERGVSMSSIGRLFERNSLINLSVTFTHGRHQAVRTNAVKVGANFSGTRRDTLQRFGVLL